MKTTDYHPCQPELGNKLSKMNKNSYLALTHQYIKDLSQIYFRVEISDLHQLKFDTYTIDLGRYYLYPTETHYIYIISKPK